MSARRPALLAVAAAVAAWSAWIVWQGDAGDDSIAQAADRPATAVRPDLPRTPPAPRPRAVPEVPVTPAVPLEAPGTPPATRLTENAAGNAFASRSFAAPPPPPPPRAVAPVAPPVVEVAPPPPPPAPPPVPPLPYRFVGLLDEAQPGGARVFLAVGDKLLVAGPGDVLDGGFRLDEIRATELVFTHVQLGRTVRLPLAGVPS